MKVSEIKIQDIADYIKEDLEDLPQTTKNFLETALAAAKAFIKSYTGIKEQEVLDAHEEFPIVVYVLVQDMYDTRSLYVDKANLNTLVETILGMYSENLL
ncbi:MAG: hypothetical protein K0R00_903 [Herbinix sp.]|jgi:GTPase Era involved in 16S rRNA processing|nr:hypothetical protein [Herbinix sp.]